MSFSVGTERGEGDRSFASMVNSLYYMRDNNSEGKKTTVDRKIIQDRFNQKKGGKI